METRLILSPGQNGTKKLVKQYGEKLVCVRYRYDKVRNRRYRTVELIVDEVSWHPKEAVRNGPAHRKPSDRVGVRIDYHEVELREEVKAVGGIWRPKQKLLEMSYATAATLNLANRIEMG